MIHFNGNKYQTNVTVEDESYNGKLLFFMKEFVSFGTDLQSIYFMSTRFLKDKIGGVCVPQFQLSYIRNTTHPLHKNMVKFFHGMHYICQGNQEL